MRNSREAIKKNRLSNGIQKREEELKLHNKEKPLTYNLGELFTVNEAKGFIQHKYLRVEHREKR